jgi:hypothetical protein
MMKVPGGVNLVGGPAGGITSRIRRADTGRRCASAQKEDQKKHDMLHRALSSTIYKFIVLKMTNIPASSNRYILTQ